MSAVVPRSYCETSRGAERVREACQQTQSSGNMPTHTKHLETCQHTQHLKTCQYRHLKTYHLTLAFGNKIVSLFFSSFFSFLKYCHSIICTFKTKIYIFSVYVFYYFTFKCNFQKVFNHHMKCTDSWQWETMTQRWVPVFWKKIKHKNKINNSPTACLMCKSSYTQLWATMVIQNDLLMGIHETFICITQFNMQMHRQALEMHFFSNATSARLIFFISIQFDHFKSEQGKFAKSSSW